MFKVIKEHSDNRCCIRTDCYGNSLSFIKKLIDIAKEDYPSLKDEDIKIEKYGGTRIKGTFGIEFNVKKVNDDYRLINNLETLA